MLLIVLVVVRSLKKNVKNQLEGFGFGACQVYVLLSVSMHSAAGDVDSSYFNWSVDSRGEL